MRPPQARLWRAGVVGVALAMGLAACGGSGGKEEAKEPELTIAERVELAQAPVDTWQGPAKPVIPPKTAKVTILSCGATDFSCEVSAQAAKAAAQELGWEATVVDGKYLRDRWNATAEWAVSDGHDALILAGIDPGQMSKGVVAAQEAGMPVVGTGYPPVEGEAELDGHITIDYAASGETMALHFVEESGGTKRISIIDSELMPEVRIRSSSFMSTVKKECETCDVSRTFFNGKSANVGMSGQIASILTVSNPKSSYLLAPYGNSESSVVEGIENFVHRNSSAPRPQLMGFGSSPEAAKRIKDGSQVAAQVSPLTYMGWLAIDQTARLLAEQTPKKVQLVPERLIDKDNIDALNGGAGWQTEYDFKAKFLDLWGVAA